MRAPVVVFAYNRKEHLKRTLEALAANEGADETSLYIYCLLYTSPSPRDS